MPRSPRMSAWGEDLVFTQGPGSADRHGFTHRERDNESSTMHFRARPYDPRTGRFLGKDPILSRRALSHYLYASNNPVMRTDPLGEEDLYTDDGTARWVVENRGTFVDSDVEEVRIGTVSGDQITLDAEFGGGTISVAKAKEIARSHAYMRGVAKAVRRSQIRNALHGDAVARLSANAGSVPRPGPC